jgi:hypothetical protein
LFCVLIVSIVLFYVLIVSIVLFCVLIVSIVLFCVLFVCKCVLYYCHLVSTQLQLNISYHIKSYHIISYIKTYQIISYISYITSHRIISHNIIYVTTVLPWIIYTPTCFDILCLHQTVTHLLLAQLHKSLNCSC